MGKLKAKFDQFRFKGILVITFIFALISIVLFIELSGVQVNYTQKKMLQKSRRVGNLKKTPYFCIVAQIKLRLRHMNSLQLFWMI